MRPVTLTAVRRKVYSNHKKTKKCAFQSDSSDNSHGLRSGDEDVSRQNISKKKCHHVRWYQQSFYRRGNICDMLLQDLVPLEKCHLQFFWRNVFSIANSPAAMTLFRTKFYCPLIFVSGRFHPDGGEVGCDWLTGASIRRRWNDKTDSQRARVTRRAVQRNWPRHQRRTYQLAQLATATTPKTAVNIQRPPHNHTTPPSTRHRHAAEYCKYRRTERTDGRACASFRWMHQSSRRPMLQPSSASEVRSPTDRPTGPLSWDRSERPTINTRSRKRRQQ